MLLCCSGLPQPSCYCCFLFFRRPLLGSVWLAMLCLSLSLPASSCVFLSFKTVSTTHHSQSRRGAPVYCGQIQNGYIGKGKGEIKRKTVAAAAAAAAAGVRVSVCVCVCVCVRVAPRTRTERQAERGRGCLRACLPSNLNGGPSFGV
jgi:hypothetical protein